MPLCNRAEPSRSNVGIISKHVYEEYQIQHTLGNIIVDHGSNCEIIQKTLD
jgi:hypothetical protein